MAIVGGAGQLHATGGTGERTDVRARGDTWLAEIDKRVRTRAEGQSERLDRGRSSLLELRAF